MEDGFQRQEGEFGSYNIKKAGSDNPAFFIISE